MRSANKGNARGAQTRRGDRGGAPLGSTSTSRRAGEQEESILVAVLENSPSLAKNVLLSFMLRDESILFGSGDANQMGKEKADTDLFRGEDNGNKKGGGAKTRSKGKSARRQHRDGAASLPKSNAQGKMEDFVQKKGGKSHRGSGGSDGGGKSNGSESAAVSSQSSSRRGNNRAASSRPSPQTASRNSRLRISETEQQGLIGSAWSSRALRNAAAQFCDKAPVTARVHEVCLLVPVLLDTFFDVILTDAPPSCLRAIIPAIFTRTGLLFGPPNFQGRVRRILIERCLACLLKNPRLLGVHLVPIIEIMMSSGASSGGVGAGGVVGGGLGELSLNMCWIVGEHATAEVLGLRAVSDLFGALETLAYEHIFTSGMHGSADESGSTEEQKELIATRSELYGTRLLHVLISVRFLVVELLPGLLLVFVRFSRFFLTNPVLFLSLFSRSLDLYPDLSLSSNLFSAGLDQTRGPRHRPCASGAVVPEQDHQPSRHAAAPERRGPCRRVA